METKELLHIRTEVCALLLKGHFELRKWSSNSAQLLSDISEANHGLACNKVLQPDDQLKILGLIWNPSCDSFQFQVSPPNSILLTKRSLLSTIAKIFDPLGWCTPVTVTAKILLQRLWQLKLDWDETLPSNLVNQWKSIQASLSALDDMQIARWSRHGSDTIHCELHGFADASSAAYAAGVYLHVTSCSGEITTALLVGKSKVASVKPMTIPRLELSAAVLLARLMTFVQTALHMSTLPFHCWTDSTIVLAWLRQHPSKWTTFVSNRVALVQELLPTVTWSHVPTQDNPADCASRGLLDETLGSHNLWWHGPDWLRLDKSAWPQQDGPAETHHEENLRAVTHLATSTRVWDLASQFSSWPSF